MNAIKTFYIILLICMFVGFMFWTYLHWQLVNGAQSDIITPHNTGNNQYCGFGERVSEGCINIIPQNTLIPLSSIDKDVSTD